MAFKFKLPLLNNPLMRNRYEVTDPDTFEQLRHEILVLDEGELKKDPNGNVVDAGKPINIDNLNEFSDYLEDNMAKKLWVDNKLRNLLTGGSGISVSWSESQNQWTVSLINAPYIVDVSSWAGTTGNYYYTISASSHGKGLYPQVQTYVNGEQTYDSPKVDFATGNITIYSNTPSVTVKVVVR